MLQLAFRYRGLKWSFIRVLCVTVYNYYTHSKASRRVVCSGSLKVLMNQYHLKKTIEVSKIYLSGIKYSTSWRVFQRLSEPSDNAIENACEFMEMWKSCIYERLTPSASWYIVLWCLETCTVILFKLPASNIKPKEESLRMIIFVSESLNIPMGSSDFS